MYATQWKQALALAMAMALGASAVSAAEPTQGQSPAYQSSIKVPEQNDDERGESAKLASLAKIDRNQATAAALAKVPGTVLKTELDNENGNLVYSVEIRLPGNETRDVKVDAGNGAVLQVDTEAEGEDRDEAEDGGGGGAALQNPFGQSGPR